MRHNDEMEEVTGIGGLFFRARDPQALAQWYMDRLGVTLVPSNYEELPWQQAAGSAAFAPFPETSDYFGPGLDALVAQLRAAGISVEVDPQPYPNGLFARLYDPVGKAIELWEPAERGAP